MQQDKHSSEHSSARASKPTSWQELAMQQRKLQPSRCEGEQQGSCNETQPNQRRATCKRSRKRGGTTRKRSRCGHRGRHQQQLAQAQAMRPACGARAARTKESCKPESVDAEEHELNHGETSRKTSSDQEQLKTSESCRQRREDAEDHVLNQVRARAAYSSTIGGQSEETVQASSGSSS